MTGRRQRSGGLPRRSQAGGDLLLLVALVAAIGGILAQTAPARAAMATTNVTVSMTFVPTSKASVTAMAFGDAGRTDRWGGTVDD